MIILGFLILGVTSDQIFLHLFLVFLLAIVIGYMVIWNVTPALHTPLMSVTNAISGIIIIGAMMELEAVEGSFDGRSGLAVVAVLVSSINVAGGFVVTHRMLKMFRREGD